METQETFRSLIQQQRVPCLCETETIFPGMSFSTFAPEQLANILRKETLKFRVGKRDSSELQWEGLCRVHEASIDDIISWNSIQDCIATNEIQKKMQKTLNACCSKHYWCYADYMYMKDLFRDHLEFLPLLDWDGLGFTNKDGSDSTMWLGTAGAHTLCHYDTYGYNIVVQISGSKKWTLFPPSDSEFLYPTRIPYEESSVFSEVNVSNPDLEKHPKFSFARACVVILKPGDMLYVPHHWWHYVENLELSVSVNLWYEVESDAKSRLNESITRLLVGSCSHVSTSPKIPWLNPNEDTRSVKSIDEGLRYLHQSINEARQKKSEEHTTELDTFPINPAPCIVFRDASFPILIKPLTLINYLVFLNAEKRRNTSYQIMRSPIKKLKTISIMNREKCSTADLTYTEFVQCLTHKDVVNAITKVILNRVSEEESELDNPFQVSQESEDVNVDDDPIPMLESEAAETPGLAQIEPFVKVAQDGDDVNVEDDQPVPELAVAETPGKKSIQSLIKVMREDDYFSDLPTMGKGAATMPHLKFRRGNRFFTTEFRESEPHHKTADDLKCEFIRDTRIKDELGHIYTVKRRSAHTITWRCIMRRNPYCSATVVQRGPCSFSRNNKPHNHPVNPGDSRNGVLCRTPLMTEHE